MTDEQIVDLYWARAEDAIAQTHKAYGPYFHYIAYSILQHDEDADEIVNDTYLKAWNMIPPERPSPLKAFLGRITRQLAINRLEAKQSKKRGGGQYFLALEEIAGCIPGGDGTELAELTALRDTLNRFLQSLPADARRVFIRRYWYMNSTKEIAAHYAISESKVKSMLMRTREKLRKHLSEEGFDV